MENQKKLGDGSNVIRHNEQLNYLDHLFSSGRRLTVKQIQEELQEAGATDISQATVYRRIETLKKIAPLIKDENSRYFYSSKEALMIPAGVISSGNLKAINVLQNLMESIKGTPVYDDAKAIVDQLSELVKETEEKKDSKNFNQSYFCDEVQKSDALTAKFSGKEGIASRVIFLGAPSSEFLPSVWNDIYHAMEINYPIVISYKKAGSKNCVSYGLEPYQLIFDNGIWDLWAYSLKDKKRKQFNLSRIKSVTIRKDSQKFKLPEDFDYYNQTPGTFGCYRDPDGKMLTYRILLKKGSYAESFASERVWGANPGIQQTEEGTVIQFDNNQYAPILRWVLGWGRDAIPLEPEKLVADWKSEVHDMNHNSQK